VSVQASKMVDVVCGSGWCGLHFNISWS
jgi:hypothetical protein